MERHLTFLHELRQIPVILSPQEIGRLLEAAPGPKYKAAMSAASAGLRVSEVLALKVANVDSNAWCCALSRAAGGDRANANGECLKDQLSPQQLHAWWRGGSEFHCCPRKPSTDCGHEWLDTYK
jgi:integrase/recombinase XerD